MVKSINFADMKARIRAIVLTALAMLIAAGQVAEGRNKTAQLKALVADFSGQEGFETVNLGWPFMQALKLAAKAGTDDPEDREALKAFKGIKRLTIVDYEDCSAAVKERFTRKLHRILADQEVILEAKDDGETVRIYGLTSDSGDSFKDLVIDTGDALICVTGTVRLDQVGALTEVAK